VVCLILGVRARHDWRRLLGCRTVRGALAAYSALFLWTLVMLGVIRHYSGAAWVCDWVEHFHRSLFFLHHFPKNVQIQCGFELPARPPMMNLLGAFFLAQTGDRYELFQITFAFLNLLLFFPCYLLSGALAPKAKRRILPLAALFALNPMIMENATYTWTKQLTAFYVVLGIWFYLAALRKNDRLRMVAGFISLSAGILVHYSAGPYAVFVGLHYLLFRFWRRHRRWSELALAVSCSLALLATWFAWSAVVYGWRSTLSSNTTVTSAQTYQDSQLKKYAANMFDIVVPFPFRTDATLTAWDQPSRAGRLRDFAFLLYQSNLVLAFGIAGGPLLLYLLFRAFRKKTTDRAFWLMLIPFSIAVGVAVQPDRQEFGAAHVTLQPLVALGLAYLAIAAPHLRRIAATALILGCAVDFAFGVFLQARVENIENTAEQEAFALDFSSVKLTPVSYVLNSVAWYNWYYKHLLSACENGVDKAAQTGIVSATEARAVSGECRENDVEKFGGWYSRHNGEITFLGDWAAPLSLSAIDAASVVMVLLALGWMAGLKRTLL
jgi:hypothetical protein